MSDFWKRVDEELDYLGFTRTYLADKCGFSLTNIGQGIKLGSVPSADTALKIARALNVSVEYLVTGSETSKDSSQFNIDITLCKKHYHLIQKLDKLSPEKIKILDNLITLLE